jgi:hypothetical protein
VHRKFEFNLVSSAGFAAKARRAWASRSSRQTRLRVARSSARFSAFRSARARE